MDTPYHLSQSYVTTLKNFFIPSYLVLTQNTLRRNDIHFFYPISEIRVHSNIKAKPISAAVRRNKAKNTPLNIAICK